MESKKTYKIGITGGLASGKSTITKFLEASGVSVLNADSVLYNLFVCYPDITQRISDHFGDDVLDSHRRIVYKKLNALMFSSPEVKKYVDGLTYPKVREEIKRYLYGPIGTNIRGVLFSSLIEMGIEHLFDEIWVLTIDPKIQRERLMKRDRISEEEAMVRIQNSPQVDLSNLKADANYLIIDNSDIQFETQQKVLEALNKIKRKFFRTTF
jgi:dephospho-CoA kinase